VFLTLFAISVALHGYSGPETSVVLRQLLSDLPSQLSSLKASSQNSALPEVTQELVEYVDGGRNPDVYTREFMELTVRGNQTLRGRGEAFEGFAGILMSTIERGDSEGMGKILKESSS
jgi:mediator of RNA polymerase II transcription subunit 10